MKKSPRYRLRIDLDSALARRIEAAAEAENLSVEQYIVRLLEEWVPRKNAGRVTAEMIRRSDELRARQKAPFPEDSVDLIRQVREERDAQL